MGSQFRCIRCNECFKFPDKFGGWKHFNGKIHPHCITCINLKEKEKTTFDIKNDKKKFNVEDDLKSMTKKRKVGKHAHDKNNSEQD